MEKSNEASIQQLEEVILKTFYFFETDSYYSPLFKQETSDIFLLSLDAEYSNNITRRQINVSYTKSSEASLFRHSISISIIRLP